MGHRERKAPNVNDQPKYEAEEFICVKRAEDELC